MLGKFSSGDNNFGIGNTVVGKEEAFKVVLGLVVVVDDVPDFVDELDDFLGVHVGRGSLS